MFDLSTARTILIIVICVAAAMLLGDLIGHKLGRVKLATYALFTVLGVVIAFAIYAAVTA